MLRNSMKLIYRLGWSFALTCVAGVSARAEEPADRLRENEQKQEELSVDTRKLAAAIEGMLDEYARNQLGGAEVLTVEKLRGSLERLSAAEMRRVIDLLQQARAIAEPGSNAKTVADAFSLQKQIVVAIQRILAEHSRTREAQELAGMVRALADRQARNLQSGIELGRMAAGARPENFDAVLQAQLEIQRGEQAAIAAELKVLSPRVERFATDPSNAGPAERFRASAQQLQALQPRAESAEAALRAGQLFRAVTDEKINRDELRRIARTLAPREKGADALRQAERELAQLISEQERLSEDTGKQQADTDYDRWILQRIADIDPNRTLQREFRRMTPEQRRANPELRAIYDKEQAAKAAQLAKMEDQQGELAVRNDELAQNVAEVSSAAEALKRATAAMQEARSAMQEANAPAAQNQQGAAVSQMRSAQAELRKKAEEAELLAGNSGDKLRDLERMRTALEELAKQEDAIANAARPDLAQQANATRRTAQMAQRSRELAPGATPAIREAAAHAAEAQTALEKNQVPAARQEAQRTAEQLREAAQRIRQEVAAAQQAAEQRQQIEATLAELAKLIEAEQKLQLDTVRLTAENNAGELRALGARQTAIEQKTTAFKASLAGGMIAAVQSLNDAETAMELASAELQKASGSTAREAETVALARLFDAQRQLTAMLEATRQAMGTQFADAGAMAEAANRIAQALQNVNSAQEAMQQAAQQMGQEAARTAAEAARQAAQAAQQAAQTAQAAQQQAQQAGNQPAAQSAANAQQSAEAAAGAAQQAAQAAERMNDNSGTAAVQQAEQAAQQAGQAAQAAQRAANAAREAQRAAGRGSQAASAAAANQNAGQQAAQAAESANQAALAARQAQQMANAAARIAEAGMQAAGQSMQRAASQLAQSAAQAAQASGQPGSSASMQQSVQAAAQQLANAMNEAMNGRGASAQQAAQRAAQQLAQASDLAAAAQAGISQAGQGQMPGQGQQGSMPGQGMQGPGRQPGQGQGSGPASQANNQSSEGATGYQAGSPDAVQRAARQAALRNAGFLGLPARERAAIQQSLGEKYPQEFGPLVEQYLLNLANEPARK